MCARFFVDDDVIEMVSEITVSQDAEIADFHHGDVRPSGRAPIIAGKQDDLYANVMAWGVPRFVGKGLVINARSESVTEKSMFRDSILRRRCVVPAKHFYEWDASKNKITFRRSNEPVLYMAGIYDRFDGRDRFTVLTTAANDSVSRFHDRMPVILNRDELEPWIFEDGVFSSLMKKKMPVLEHWQDNEQMSLF